MKSVVLILGRTGLLVFALTASQAGFAQSRVMPIGTPNTPGTPGTPTTSPAPGSPATPASSASTSTSTQVAPATTANTSSLHIGPGDLVNVNLFGVQEFNSDVRVDDAGNVSLPLIKTVHLEGLTPSQAQALITMKLVDGGYYRNPSVSIFVKEYATQGISVFGEVQKPGIYPLLGPHSLADVISAAGGTTDKAGSTATITRRVNPTQPAIVPIVHDPQNPNASTIEVSPGDTVEISKAGIVYVVGDVRMPGGFVMPNNSQLTVLQALAMAQGANSTAALNHAKLIHKTPTGHTEESIPLKKILSDKAPDLQLQAEDIVFVPNSASKTAFHRGLEAAVQTATGVTIYHRF